MRPINLIKQQRGGSLIEFAVLLPLLILIVFGIIEFGLLLYDQQVITNASREGARYGIVARPTRHTEGEIRAVVENYCSDRLVTFGSWTEPLISTDPSPTSPTALFGDDLTVEVQWRYDFLVLPDFLGRALSARTVMKYE